MNLYLEKNKSSFSNNKESVINVTLSNKTRQLPNNDISSIFSLYEQYNKERDNCDKIRLIVNINPICSNVLFNNKTEIVIKEGSKDVKCLLGNDKNDWDKNEVASSASNSTNPITQLQAIRDTEYSHKDLGNFIYHCGLDIFNNHILRNDGFVHVNKNQSESVENEHYNTISDLLRYEDGKQVKQNFNPIDNTIRSDVHLYQYDKILSFKRAFQERCKEKDGWWGFINSGNINMANRNDGIHINQIMVNNKPCEFIDLYPDRSLFSFNPKFNKYRRRIEKNWNYCITYPFSKSLDEISGICGDNKYYSLIANCFITTNSNGISVVQCESYFKHNLKEGDSISLFYKGENGYVKLRKEIRVATIGDNSGENKEKIFTIRYNDIASIYTYFEENGNHLNFKKCVNGADCSYYTRIFKKIGELKSDINKVAFGKNIYGDDISQIIFLDDIDLNNLYDNKGRKVSEVYLTIVKNNAGNKEWYNGSANTETVEFSHCFGEITSGFDFSGIKDEPDDYNIHKMHNVYADSTTIEKYAAVRNTIAVLGDSVGEIDNDGKVTSKVIKTLESGIIINKETFLGDIVEFNPVSYTETVISNVYHRFNTYQREKFDTRFRDIFQDVIVADDYDAAIGTSVKTSDDEPVRINEFTVKTYYINDMKYFNNDYDNNDTNTETLIYGNICPEGYFYNPHIRIKISEEDELVDESEAKLINTTNLNISGNTISLTAPTNFGFYKGDNIAFYNKNTGDVIWSEIIQSNNTHLVLRLDDNKINENNKINYELYWSPDNVPTYATLMRNKRKFTWRKLLPQSQLNSKHSLFETPFSNGRLYIEKNVNFFLRRQDPTGKYGLSKPIYKNVSLVNPMKDYIITGNEPYDFSRVIININNFDNCY